MFCSKCGTQIADSSKFCPKCGEKTVVNTTSTPVPVVEVVNPEPELQDGRLVTTVINQETLDAIQQLLPPLEKIKNDTEKTNLEEIQKKINYLEKRYGFGTFLAFALGLGVVFTWIGFFIVGLFYNLVFHTDSFPLIMITDLILAFTISFLNAKHVVSSRKERISQYYDDIAAYKQRVAGYWSEMDPQTLQLIPPDYRYYDATAYIYNAIINQRAGSMKEAVNLLEDEIKHNQNLFAQYQIAYAQMQLQVEMYNSL